MIEWLIFSLYKNIHRFYYSNNEVYDILTDTEDPSMWNVPEYTILGCTVGTLTVLNCWVCGALSFQCDFGWSSLYTLSAMDLNCCSIRAVLRAGILLFFSKYSGQSWASYCPWHLWSNVFAMLNQKYLHANTVSWEETEHLHLSAKYYFAVDSFVTAYPWWKISFGEVFKHRFKKKKKKLMEFKRDCDFKGL